MRRGFLTAALLGSLVLVGCSSDEVQAPLPTANLGARGPSAAWRGASGAGQAATGRKPVDLPTVMRLASGRNLDVKLVRERLQEAHAEMVQAGWWVLPTIRPAARFNWIDGNVQATEGPIIDVDKQNAFVGAAVYVDWELGDAIFEQLASQQRANASRQDLRAGVNDATLKAAEAYFDLLRAQTALAVADESLALYTNLAQETRAQADAGKGFRGDVLRARARLSHARVVQRKAAEDQRKGAARLREILDLPATVELYASEGQPVKLDLVDAEVPQAELLAKAMCARAELRSARFMAAAAKADRNKTTLGPYIPRVTAGWEGGAFGHTLGSSDGSSNLGVGLEWKVGRGGIGDSARSAAAAARERQARLKIRKTRQRIVREVASAQAAAQTRSEAIAAAAVGAKEAKEALDLYRQRQEIGVGIPLDAIYAEETFSQARLDYLDAVIGFNKAQVRLLRAVGHSVR